MGSYTYCRSCGEGMNLPTVEEIAHDEYCCSRCNKRNELPSNEYAEMICDMDSRIKDLEERVKKLLDRC